VIRQKGKVPKTEKQSKNKISIRKFDFQANTMEYAEINKKHSLQVQNTECTRTGVVGGEDANLTAICVNWISLHKIPNTGYQW
jgi:hypothetical protein